MWSYQSRDEGQIDSGRKSSGRNPAFNLYLYNFFAILASQASCTFLASLLQCIGQNFCMNYSRVLVYSEGHFFFYFLCQ